MGVRTRGIGLRNQAGAYKKADGAKGARPVRATSGQRGNHTATAHAARVAGLAR